MKEKGGTNRRENPQKSLSLVFSIVRYSTPKLDRVRTLDGYESEACVTVLAVLGVVRDKDILEQVIQGKAFSCVLGRFPDGLSCKGSSFRTVRSVADGVLVTNGRGLARVARVAGGIPIRNCPEFWAFSRCHRFVIG